MINKYKNLNKEMKQYKVNKVKQGTAKNGASFTVCSIAGSKKVGDNWVKEYYGVFSWQPNIDLKDGDLIELLDITALEVKEEEYNGQKSIKKTIFANIKVIPQAPQGNAPAELTPIDDISGELPF